MDIFGERQKIYAIWAEETWDTDYWANFSVHFKSHVGSLADLGKVSQGPAKLYG